MYLDAFGLIGRGTKSLLFHQFASLQRLDYVRHQDLIHGKGTMTFSGRSDFISKTLSHWFSSSPFFHFIHQLVWGTNRVLKFHFWIGCWYRCSIKFRSACLDRCEKQAVSIFPLWSFIEYRLMKCYFQNALLKRTTDFSAFLFAELNNERSDWIDLIISMMLFNVGYAQNKPYCLITSSFFRLMGSFTSVGNFWREKKNEKKSQDGREILQNIP